MSICHSEHCFLPSFSIAPRGLHNVNTWIRETAHLIIVPVMSTHTEACSGQSSTIRAKQTFPKLLSAFVDKTTKEPQLKPLEIIDEFIQQTATWMKKLSSHIYSSFLLCCSSMKATLELQEKRRRSDSPSCRGPGNPSPPSEGTF